ncbi:hypothetical protein BD410DRAFT_792591 [Rickenella mellea]|uniref:Uncharacterized protein n=1 Tax=Rickenella mellea TaxID=50990 RepID=A0A4Y7PVC3_9AGAM|nr:hypothetical protein BD410DRAFT_792591 [Rickenella mellea]
MPFTPFPILRSHIHPFFVICNAFYAFHFHVSKDALPPHLKEHWDLLRSIYGLWVRDEQTVSESINEDDRLEDQSAGNLSDDFSTCIGNEGREPDIQAEDGVGTHHHPDTKPQDTCDRLSNLGDYYSDCSSEPEMEIIHPLNISLWAKQTIWAWDDDDGSDKAKVEAAWEREVKENLHTLAAEQHDAIRDVE